MSEGPTLVFRLVLLLLFVVGACGPRTAPYQTTARPVGNAFAAAVPIGHTRFSNDSLSHLFTDLVFDTEWGASVPTLMRLDPPVNVGLVGLGSEAYAPFLDRLLEQIAREAEVEIARGTPPHTLTVRLVPGLEWAPLSGNQCIIVFGRPTWPEFLRDRRRYSDYRAVSPNELRYRTVFIPNTNEPYEIRECLIEEITQALGPSNDIYGLGPSIFNDDDAHVWPTRLDYLMLRVLYHPEMASGIPRDEAVRRARHILDEINPDGRTAPELPEHRQKDFLKWRRKLHELYDLVSAGKAGSRRAGDIVASILKEAERRAPDSAYHCEALSVAASVERERETGRDGPAFERATAVCARVHGDADVRAAALRLSRAIVLLRENRNRTALDQIKGLPQLFLAHGQDALLAMTHAVRWAALENIEDPRARDAHKMALEWSAYAFGEDHAMVQRWRRF